MIFLVFFGKMIFLFPENMILPLGRKMKDDLSQKNTWKNDVFFKTFWKDGLFKKIAPEHDLSCIIWKGWKMKDDISQEIRGGTTFSVYTNVTSCLSAKKKKKNQRWSYRTKIHLKAIDILDWRSRKSSNNSLYFYGDLSYIAFQRKKQET